MSESKQKPGYETKRKKEKKMGPMLMTVFCIMSSGMDIMLMFLEAKPKYN